MIRMRQTHHDAMSAGLVTALSLVVTLEGMPTPALAATPTEAPSAQSEAPSSRQSGTADAASAPDARGRATAPTEKKASAPTEKKASPTSGQKGTPSPQPQQPPATNGTAQISKNEETEEGNQVPQTKTTSGDATAAANRDGQAQAKQPVSTQTNQHAVPTPAEAAAPGAVRQDSQAQSVSVGVRTVNEQGKSVEGAAVSVNAGVEHRPSNAAGTYDLTPGETVTVVADAPTYAHVEQTFVVNGSPIAITMPKSEQASAPHTSTGVPRPGVGGQNQAVVDRMAQEFDTSFDDINLLSFAPQYNAGASVVGAIKQRLAGDAPKGLTVSVASSSDASVIAANGTLGRDATSEVTPYETAGSSECSFTFSLEGAQATTSMHTVQVGYWSTAADGRRASHEMQGDIALPNSFRADDGVPLVPPTTVPDNASFTWRLVSPDSSFALTTDADDGTQMLVAHGQGHATSALLEAAMVPSRVADYDFYFYPMRSFMLRMGADAQIAVVDDPLHPTAAPHRLPSRAPRPGRPVAPMLVSAVVPEPIVPTVTPTSPTSDDATPASSAATPSASTGITATKAASTPAAATWGAATPAGTRAAAHASGTSAPSVPSSAFPSLSAPSPDATSATNVAPFASDPVVHDQGLLGALRSTVVTAASASQRGVGVLSPGAPAAPLVPFAGVAMGLACITGAIASLARRGAKPRARK